MLLFNIFNIFKNFNANIFTILCSRLLNAVFNKVYLRLKKPRQCCVRKIILLCHFGAFYAKNHRLCSVFCKSFWKYRRVLARSVDGSFLLGRACIYNCHHYWLIPNSSLVYWDLAKTQACHHHIYPQNERCRVWGSFNGICLHCPLLCLQCFFLAFCFSILIISVTNIEKVTILWQSEMIKSDFKVHYTWNSCVYIL